MTIQGLMLNRSIFMDKLNIVIVIQCIIFMGFLSQLAAQPLSAYIESSGAKTEFCPGQVIALVGVANGGSGNYIEHSWTDNSGILLKSEENVAVVKTNISGLYTLTYHVKDDSGSMATAAVTIKINTPPFAEIIRVDGALKLTNISGEGKLLYSWFKNGVRINNNGPVKVSDNTEYKLVITDEKGCSFISTVKF